MIMVNEKRLVAEFIELASIDSPSFDERRVADAIIKKVSEMGITVHEDKAGEIYGGNTGNLYFTISGRPNTPSILLMAHMDTVVPCKIKKIVIDGDVIKSDGTTILGSDDVAGIVEILESIRVLREQKIAHGDVEVVFTIGEEKSLCGSKVLEFGRIKSKIALVLDNHGTGRAAIRGPSQYQIEAVFKGKSAHAGIEPEKGLNAIEMAANAISKMRLGRIDDETTANVGVISGGEATNIVCDSCDVKFETRSRDAKKLEIQAEHMKAAILKAAEEVGGSVEISQELLYPSFNIAEDDELIVAFQKGCKKIGIEPVLEATGGGSDTNIISGKGIRAIDLGCGMTDVHTLNETVKISDLIIGAKLIVSIIETIGEGGAK
ncbi:MAG: M20/M25/M40 family metallo-hydrolase [Bacillota bacterium]